MVLGSWELCNTYDSRDLIYTHTMSEMDNMTCRKESAAYKDGDFEIIASDGLVFRIQSYHLLSARLVSAE